MKFVCKSFLLISLLFSFTATSRPVHANQACHSLFSKILHRGPTPVAGEKYRIQFIGNPTTSILTFVSAEVQNGKAIYVLQGSSSSNQVYYRVRADSIAEIRTQSKSTVLSVATRLISAPFALAASGLSIVLAANEIGRLIYLPYKKLAKNEKAVTIIGGFTASKKIAQNIADNLEVFDNLLMTMGFVRPQHTNVRISGPPVIPTISSSAAWIHPIKNLWTARNQKAGPNMVMQNQLWSTRQLQSDSVLFHERTHILFHSSFKLEAFVLRNETFQEAVADFLTAHHTGSTQIGPKLEKSDYTYRDIRSKEARTSARGTPDSRSTLLSVEQGSYHENSMILSNVFWRVREIIGSEEINTIFKPLMDSLNSLRDSYDNLLLAENRVATKDAIQDFIYDLEFVLAVILKSSRDWRHATEIDNLLNQISNEYGLDFNRIEYITEKLNRSNEDFSYDPSYDGKRKTAMMIFGAGGMIIHTSYWVWVIDAIITKI